MANAQIGAWGKLLVILVQVAPPSAVRHARLAPKPVNPTQTILLLARSMAMAPTCVPGLLAPILVSTRVQVAPPSVVISMRLLAQPTQITFELLGATAMETMLLPIEALIAVHCGPPVGLLQTYGVRASLVTQRDKPPTRSRLALFGSSRIGAIKFAVPLHASSMRYGAARQVQALPL